MKLINILATIILACSLIGCAKTVYIPIKGKDIIKTKYKEIIKDSIIYITLEKDNKENTLDATRDTVSVLMNRYSTSKAEVKSGVLNHTLMTRSKDSLPIQIQYKDIIKIDSVYIEKPVITEVEKPIRDKIFYYLLIGNVILVMIIIGKVKKFLTL